MQYGIQFDCDAFPGPERQQTALDILENLRYAGLATSEGGNKYTVWCASQFAAESTVKRLASFLVAAKVNKRSSK